MPTSTADAGDLYLLDGNSLVFRAFFALPIDLATKAGQVTNAVHGFTSMLVMLLRDNEPGGMAVAFDRPEPTFRDDIVEDYKGNRPETPDLLVPQFALVRAVLGALGIVMVEKPGYEADDILATLATQGRDAGRNVVVVSGDRDTFQLVEDPLVKVMYTRRGLSDTVVYDEAGIVERHGVSPKAYPVLAALRGDTSDNLPGVPGVGEKTAAKLVSTYGDLDGIFSHVGEQTPKLRQSLSEHEDQVRRNAEVIPLVRDVELDVTVDDLALGKWDAAEVKRRLRRAGAALGVAAPGALARRGRRGVVAPRRGRAGGAHRRLRLDPGLGARSRRRSPTGARFRRAGQRARGHRRGVVG